MPDVDALMREVLQIGAGLLSESAFFDEVDVLWYEYTVCRVCGGIGEVETHHDDCLIARLKALVDAHGDWQG